MRAYLLVFEDGSLLQTYTLDDAIEQGIESGVVDAITLNDCGEYCRVDKMGGLELIEKSFGPADQPGGEE